MNQIDYQERPEFKADFKKLQKKWSTLAEDLKNAQTYAIEAFHLKSIDSQSIVPIPGLKSPLPIFKLRKFSCKALKGKGAKTGLRLIYAYDEANLKVTLIEIYYKGDKDVEDKHRLRAYIKTISKPPS